VMSSDILGNEFDIHGGGIDLIFPHHENEIAQSEGAGKKFAKIWMHHGLLTINGQKMAKSLGNFITVEGALENINAQDDAKADILKDFFLGAEYSNPIDFTNKSIKESTEAIYSILELLKKDQGIKKPKEDDETIKLNIEQFGKAINDNFNMLRARACIFGIRRHCNDLLGREKTEDVKHAVQWGINTIRKLGKDVLGLSLPELNPRDPKWKDTSVINVYKDVENENKIIDDKVNERQRLRKEKKYAEADKIRKELEAKGVILEDKTDQPTEWRWKR